MRRLVITQNMTVDGRVEMLGDWFDPTGGGPDLIEQNQRWVAESDALVLGRQTFEDFRSFWPNQTDDKTGVTDGLNATHKYVVSTTITDPQWQNSTILSGDPISEIGALKQVPGKDIVITGSITLCHTVIDAGLVDEFRLFVYPAAQGTGRTLFPDIDGTRSLHLLDEPKHFDSGVALLRYAPA